MVRVRFAPSPTGPLHIGGVRTALFNYLFARQHNGKCILRIEDTDQQRFVEGAEEYIIDSLNWCGVVFDEGPHVPGPFGPYKQSLRKNIYVRYAQQLIDQGNAYYAFDTSEELEAARSINPNFLYGQHSRMNMKNSLSLSHDEVRNLLDTKIPHVIRLLIPSNEQVEVNDLIRGKVHFDSNLLDDKVIFKSDGLPTYHLANIVDDHLMEITHVIRGEEWLPSAPLHVLLYRFLGWEHPEFAHLPLILKPQGTGKLSKRDGDKLGFPVFPMEWKDPQTQEISSGYREWGYIPEAFVNMLAMLGWSSGTEQEIFSIQELISLFSLDKVQKGGAKFDPEKTKWFNHQYLLKADFKTYLPCFKSLLKEHDIVNFNDEMILIIAEKIRDRMFLIPDFWTHSFYFFKAPEATEYDNEVLRKHLTPESVSWLESVNNVVENISVWEQANIEQTIKQHLYDHQQPMGKVFNLLRVAFTGSSLGIGIADIILLLGKDETIERISTLIAHIKS